MDNQTPDPNIYNQPVSTDSVTTPNGTKIFGISVGSSANMIVIIIAVIILAASIYYTYKSLNSASSARVPLPTEMIKPSSANASNMQ